MSELPKGWSSASLHSLAGKNGLMTDGDWIESKDQDPNGEVRLIQLADIGDGFFLNRSSRFLTKKKAEELQCTYLNPGDVLIARMPDPLGRACIFPGVGQEAVTAVDVCIWRPGQDSASPEWVKYIVNSPQIRDQIAQLASGTTRQRISGGNLKQLEVPLPPLDEQRRIVARLDALLARSKRARTELARVPGLVERQKQAVLAAAFSGELTREWRFANGDNSSTEVRLELEEPYHKAFLAPLSWKQSSIDGICTIIGGSQPPKETFKYTDEPGYTRLIQIRDYKTDAFKTYIPSSLARRLCTPSDVMIARYGPPIFQILRGLEGAYNVALMKAEPKEGCLNDFLFWRMQDPNLLRYVEIGSDRTAGQDGVNKPHLLKYPIFLPNLEEQRAIILRIEAAFARIARVAAESNHAINFLDRLEQTTLTRAFQGKL